jgi:hypothetical protein
MEFGTYRNTVLDFFLASNVGRIVDNFFPSVDPGKSIAMNFLELLAQILSSTYIFTSIRSHILGTEEPYTLVAAIIIDQNNMRQKLNHLYNNQIYPLVTSTINSLRRKNPITNPVTETTYNQNIFNRQREIVQDDNLAVYNQGLSVPDDNF